MKKIFSTLNITIFLFGLAAIGSPWLFTSCSRWYWFDFTNTGQIGDTIGGLTAPVIGLLNAVLLYVTLRRQDNQINQQNQQRKEDKFEALFNRKFELIGSLIKSLELSVNFKNAPDFVEAKESGSKIYRGEQALLTARGFFLSEHDFLRFHLVAGLEWAELMNTISQIVVETIWVLDENLKSTLEIDEKKIRYEYLVAYISYIPLLFSEMTEYKKAFPNDKGLKIFKVDEYLSFKRNVDMIKLYDPDPDLKAPSTNQNMEQPPSPENA